jgi:DNA-binding beta-propeller fold protein YncE
LTGYTFDPSSRNVTISGADVSDADFSASIEGVTEYPDIVIDTISAGDYPSGVAVTPNGSYLYVGNINADTVSVIGF